MSLFRCSKCGCVENTACSDYFSRVYFDGEEPLCSECLTGKWHNKFEKQSASGCYYDKDNFVYFPDEVDEEKMEWKYNRAFKMFGRYE